MITRNVIITILMIIIIFEQIGSCIRIIITIVVGPCIAHVCVRH